MNIEQQISNDLKNLHYWEDAVDTVVGILVRNDECFSSGEVVKYIRAARPDMRFSAARVGERVRTNYRAGTLPAYFHGYPVQVSRYTSGVHGGPVGQLVFVYGPDTYRASAHDFEVDVPHPQQVAPQAQVAPTPVVARTLTKTEKFFEDVLPAYLQANPSVSDVGAVYVFEVGQLIYTVDLTQSPGRVIDQHHANADCIIRTDEATWEELMRKPGAGVRLFMSGKLKATNIVLATQLEKILAAQGDSGDGNPVPVTDGDGQAVQVQAQVNVQANVTVKGPETVTIDGSHASDAPQKATVRSDKRLTIPKQALENLVAKSGKTLVSGDTVYVNFYDSLIAIRQDRADDDSHEYTVSHSCGRVRFVSDSDTSFTPGKSYRVWTLSDRLVVDMNDEV